MDSYLVIIIMPSPPLLSVCPSRFRVCSVSFEPLVALTNNSAQMSSMMSRCAVCMFDQG